MSRAAPDPLPRRAWLARQARCGLVLLAGWPGWRPAVAAPAWVNPSHSGLRAAAPGTGGDADPRFNGRSTIHAVLFAQWLAQDIHQDSARPSYVLVPVPQSAASLPHFEGHLLRQVLPDNGPQALQLAGSAELARDFARGELRAVWAEGLFTLQDLELDGASLGCRASARALVAEVDPIRLQVAVAPQALPCTRP
jgi:hypothetical protein